MNTKRIEKKFGNSITGISDISGGKKPTPMFCVLANCLSYLLTGTQGQVISRSGIKIRKILNPILKAVCPLFLEHRQVTENKNALLGTDAMDGQTLPPDGSVIWCSNHGIKDDIAATIRIARHGYMFFGSLAHFFNTFDGFALWINGVILCNRKVKHSKKSAEEHARQLLRSGSDLIIYPEGAWNKTPEKLVLELWPGVYRLAKETGSRIVPVIHYLADPHGKHKGNVIHTVVAEPVSMDGLSEREGLELLRDTMATWYFLMMEKYGQTTREELLDGFETADDAWERYIAMHTGCVKYYDKEIELCADYRSRDIVRPEDVWKSVADIKNINTATVRHVQYAKALVAQESRRDYQRRF